MLLLSYDWLVPKLSPNVSTHKFKTLKMTILFIIIMDVYRFISALEVVGGGRPSPNFNLKKSNKKIFGGGSLFSRGNFSWEGGGNLP